MPLPSFASQAASTALTGEVAIDALLSGFKWGGEAGTSATVTYSFPWANGASATFSGYNGAAYTKYNEQLFGIGLSAGQQAAASKALQTWSNVANISFNQVSDTSTNVGDIRFAFSSASSLQNAWGYANFPNPTLPVGGDVWINSQNATDPIWSTGSTNFYSLIHEVGHAIGLKHGFELGVTLPVALDNRSETVMSYTDASNFKFIQLTTNSNGRASYKVQYVVPETPMLLDIAAVQYLYGANYAYNSDNTTYTFDPALPFLKTIWDGGGVDTISVANFSNACTIDLNPGNFSSISTSLSDSTAGYNWASPPPVGTYDAKNNLCIAYDCTIENAIGGIGSDTIIGNSTNNSLTGGPGNDYLDGGYGLDTAVYLGKRSNYKLTKTASGWQVSSNAEGIDTVIGIERIKFADMTVALDIDATAGQAYRIYQAAFKRPPDNNGLKYWIGVMDGGIPLSSVSSAFIASSEFQTLYGVNPSNDLFITKLYDNVLNRAPDTGGYKYWLGLLSSGMIDKKSMLLNFSESNENQANVIGVIQDGIPLLSS